jgi:hypothetical protein
MSYMGDLQTMPQNQRPVDQQTAIKEFHKIAG